MADTKLELLGIELAHRAIVLLPKSCTCKGSGALHPSCEFCLAEPLITSAQRVLDEQDRRSQL